MKNFKKTLVALLLVLTCLVSSTAVFASYTEAPNVTVIVDGVVLDFSGDQGPVISNGRTLLPLRKILEALDASVFWDESSRSVFSSKGDVSIALQIDSPTLFRNDSEISQQYTLDVSPMIINSRTMIPARAVSEAYGATVGWDAATSTVTIVSK